MTKGQRAMVAAKVRSLLLNNKSTTVAAREAGIAQAYVAKASLVLEYAAELSDAVVAGDKALNDAYEIALERKRQAESDQAKMQRLRNAEPDLADQVIT